LFFNKYLKYKLDLPGIGQTIELLTVPTTTPETSTSTMNVLSSTQSSAEILLQELTLLIQQPPADIVPINIEQNLIQQPMNTSGSRQARTANTYGGISVNRPGTAVKSTITSSGGGTIRKSFQQQQQTMNDDRMFFGRPTTIGQGQYHNRTGLMTNKQQVIAPLSSSLEQHHQQLSQRRPLSWFQ